MLNYLDIVKKNSIAASQNRFLGELSQHFTQKSRDETKQMP